MAKLKVTLREVLTARTARDAGVWNVADHPKTKVIGTKVTDQWVKVREGAGATREEWLEQVRAYVQRQLEEGHLPDADADGDRWYEVNTFTSI